ncbi:mechanosensitive ion channel family protein [Virgibacillus sp. MSJ-26]|uniref:mechanosensitive ion channel family protein n=1 Tax=Virgibacillus sp. MSJ-26 TaxID=2841522 RepID=UPI00209E98CD|nr:mechanosensitive ion channel family protein [Virgibacillus sp. MSJ-26]
MLSRLNNQIENFWEYISGPELWLGIGSAAFRIILILILAIIVVKMSKKIIYKVFKRPNGDRAAPIRISVRRENTLKKLIANVISYVVYFIATLMILDNVLGFNVGALLAGAGVAGLAIGFGAQNLVRDVISGFFIIFEDQFSVGDYVLVSGVEGTVEEIGLRTTKILSWTGEMNILPNGDITHVTNYSMTNGLSVVDVNIPYESDIEAAEEIIEEIAKTLPDKYDEILSVPEILGVQSLELSHFVIRVVAETEPSLQWFGERMIRKEMKEGLFKQGIEIPSPRLVMYSRDERANVLKKQREQE